MTTINDMFDKVITNFEEQFLWFIIKNGEIEFKIDKDTFIFTKNGFIYKDNHNIEYTLSEMSLDIKAELICNLPEFRRIINHLDDEIKNI
jgi:hypothetical protein